MSDYQNFKEDPHHSVSDQSFSQTFVRSFIHSFSRSVSQSVSQSVSPTHGARKISGFHKWQILS